MKDISKEKSTISKGLSANQLKWIAIVCMIIDHSAWAFVPTASALGQIMHIIGKITGPIMFFFIAEGYHKTHNFKKYALRLLIFAVISWVPFSLMQSGSPFGPNFGVICTLFLALIALKLCKSKIHKVLKVLGVIGICILSCFGDWPIFGILYVLLFGLNHGNFKKQAIWYSILSVFVIITFIMPSFFFGNFFVSIHAFGVILPLPLIYLYNGQRGGDACKKFNKWAFYIIYPAHLLLIYFIKLILI